MNTGALVAYAATWALFVTIFPPRKGTGLAARLAWPVLCLARGLVLSLVFGEPADPRTTVRSAYQRFRAEEQ